MLRFEHALIPWNKHVIMPVFALANAGVILGAGAAHSLKDPISLGVICGLVLGKPIGIVLFSWLATRSQIASMLDGVSWRQVVGVGLLGGIGFTMSLFIANLAFGDTPALETAKVGILARSRLVRRQPTARSRLVSDRRVKPARSVRPAPPIGWRSSCRVTES